MESTIVAEEADVNIRSVFGSGLDNQELKLVDDDGWAPPKKVKKAKKSSRPKLEISPADVPVEDKEPAKSWPAVFHSILAAPILVSEKGSTYSDYLTSRIVAVVVSSGKTYHLHSSLLCRESERFHKSLTSEHTEASQLKIDLIDESADNFAHFVDFLYKPNWQPSDASKIQLAELYALGERLVAQKFQDIMLRAFREGLMVQPMTSPQLCQLAGVACGKITERFHPRDDPMRDVIFWLVSRRVLQVQKTDEFRQALMEHGELGMQLILRAGNGMEQMPEDPSVGRENDASGKKEKTGKASRVVMNGWG